MTGTGGDALRALVVGDEEHLARLVADCLGKERFGVQIALDGKHALALARAGPQT